MARTKVKPAKATEAIALPSSECLNWTKLRDEIRAEWNKRERPVAIFPSREAKLAWLAEGARTGTVPPLPEGAYYE